jgi:hypothetical protein
MRRWSRETRQWPTGSCHRGHRRVCDFVVSCFFFQALTICFFFFFFFFFFFCFFFQFPFTSSLTFIFFSFLAPQPPQLKAGSNRVTNATASANAEQKKEAGKGGDQGDMMDLLKKVVAGGGGLRKTDLNEEEREKRGMSNETSFAEEQKSKLKKKEILEVRNEI